MSFLQKIGWRYLRSHLWQSILMVVGIAIGVAVVVAVDLANGSAERAFKLSTQTITGKATHQIVGDNRGVEAQIYQEIRRRDLVTAAPVIAETVSSPELGDQPLQLLGVDPFAEAPFRRYLSAEGAIPVEGLINFFIQPGAVLISQDLAREYGLTIGDPLELNVRSYPRQATIVGTLRPADNLSQRALENVILADIATVQELTGRLDQLTRVDLILDDEIPETLAELEQLLPPGVRLVTAGAQSGTAEQMTAAFRTNLTALSLLALVVGMFLIYNTMTFSVVKRRSLLGTLRCLGVTRREIFLLIIQEAAIVGVVSSAIGVALGIVLGQGAVRLVTRTINDLYFTITVSSVEILPGTLIKGVVLGLATTLVSAAAPALEASTVPPREALSRADLEQRARRLIRLLSGVGLLLLIAGPGVLSIRTRNLTVSFVGTLLVILGFALLTPSLAALLMRALIPLMGRMWGALGRMAPQEVIASMSRTSIAIAALMVAVSVIIGVNLMVGSFRFTVEAWLAQTLQGDVYISPISPVATQNDNTLDPRVLESLASWPGVQQVDTVRSVTVQSPFGRITLAAVNNPASGEERIFKEAAGSPAEIWEAMKSGAVLVSEPLANRTGLSLPGAFVIMDTPTGSREFPVVGIYYDYTSSQGTVLIEQRTYRSIWGDNQITGAALRLAPGVDADHAARQLKAALGEVQSLQIRSNHALRAEVLRVFDQTFAITRALELLAMMVAFIGVLSALLSLQLEKQRLLGILRAVGLTVRQLWGLVLLETGLMGLAAGVLAIPTGLALSYILVYIINRRSFGWTLQLALTTEPLLQALLVAVIAALLAGLYPARAMGRMSPSEALRYE